MVLTVNAHAVLVCDGKPCLAPYVERDGHGSMEMEATGPSITGTARLLRRQARKLGWEEVGVTWLCPFCTTRPPAKEEKR